MALTTLAQQNKTKINTNPSFLNDQAPNLVEKVLLEKYLVLEQKNTQSGEANIYTARDINTNDTLIIKQYRRKNAIKNDVIEVLSNLNSINVVRVLAHGEYDGYQFVVLPFYQGKSLRDYLNEGYRFDLGFLKEFISELNKTLKLIHEHDLIHKDLKPENIIITEPDNNIVLIDFGISTDLGGKTVVLTQTGKTPFYAAPETNQGVYTIESDYYAFGIMIYELFAGVTPFQNNLLNSNSVAAFSLISKIPFSDNFPQELRDLITGLTYNDLSNRKDLNNPNRRWTSREVEKWLKGEKQPIPGEGLQVQAPTKGDFEVPYFFNHNRIYTLRELGEQFMTNVSAAISEIGRGFLSRHFDQNNDQIRKEKTEKLEQELYKADQSVNKNVLLYKLIYQIIPDFKEIYWNKHKFDSLFDYGSALVEASVNTNEQNEDLIQSAFDLLTFDVLQNYVTYQISDELKSSLELVMQNNKELLTITPLDPKNQALRLGYSLTQREDFSIGSKSFKNIEEFNKYLDHLYECDVTAYVNYFYEFQDELETHKKLLVAEALQRFNKHFAQKETVLNVNGYIFKKPEDELDYELKLYKNNQIMKLHHFRKSSQKRLNVYFELLKGANKSKFFQALNNYKAIVNIDEHYFKNVDEFKKYGESLAQINLDFLTHFLRLHRTAIVNNLKREDQFEDVYGYLQDVSIGKITLANTDQNKVKILNKPKSQNLLDLLACKKDELQIGQKVFFGSFYQYQKVDNKGEEHNQMEPILWRIIAKEDQKLILLAEKGLIVKPFDSKDRTTDWPNSEIRAWLNIEFFNTAFSTEEIAVLTDHSSEGVLDKIFLLNVSELDKYLPNYEHRKCVLTQYAQVTSHSSKNFNSCNWWLREPANPNASYRSTKFKVIKYDGRLNEDGYYLAFEYNAVRPAICVSLNMNEPEELQPEQIQSEVLDQIPEQIQSEVFLQEEVTIPNKLVGVKGIEKKPLKLGL